MCQKEVCGAAVIMTGIAHDFRDRTISMIEVARKPRFPG